MKNSSKSIIIVVIVIVLVILAILSFGGSSDKSPVTPNPLDEVTGTSTAPLPVSETVKVTGSLSKYQNAELGFAVQYPSAWQRGDTNSVVQFVIPIDASQVSTVNRLEATVAVTPGKCAFPPVTTVESRGTLAVGDSTLNMIVISNKVQGRSYYNRMYSLDKTGICYFFTFTYVALSPESKGLTGSNLTQAENNNKAIRATADTAFTTMVKSLTFVAPAAGEDETKANPKK